MTRGDKIIFFLLIVGAILGLLCTKLLFATGGDSQVVVEVDGKLYGQYSLQEKNGKTIAINTEFGYNKIVIADGRVMVTESDCPDHVEIKAGAIEKNGEMLVCLPNRLVIRIEGRREVDGVVY
ncbi:MAG: NusG domain II-containing protein [Clostridia bacterium]|nr:NusG domain II-containing protein [Clostridia bacterium]